MTPSNFLRNQISRQQLQWWLPLSFILMVGGFAIASYFFELAQFPAELFEAQLAFDADIIKQHYAILIGQGTMGTFIVTQLLDYLFIIGLGTFGFLLHVAISRAYPAGSWGYRIALFGGFLFVLSASMDALENIVSFFMLADPTGFAAPLATIYSTFALVKWGIAMSSPLILIPELIAVSIRHLRKRGVSSTELGILA